ncbi:adenosylcobinamide-GDP ribazoletransferase [Hyphomicrobium sp. DY-1]|uniref:adenosylcobinamide-GDP ribazoletransferase n=1 Tax=Hyphomicrobium sp. DY-1 TaxID=3075650 RepID=UPI0039C2E3A5
MIAHEVRFFLIALQFLTRIQVKQIIPFPEDWLPRSAKYMPLVGALIGATVGLVMLAATVVFPASVAVVIGLVASVLLTGALHEDGLADTVDAFGGGSNVERRLEIMKDSRIGTYGVLALIAVLALKGTSLAAIGPVAVIGALIAAYAGGRLAAVLALAFLPYAGGDNVKVSRSPVRMTRGELIVAIVTGLAVGPLVMSIAAFFAATVVAFTAAAVIAILAQRKIGGYTGDVLGAVEQVYETAFLAVAAAVIAGAG